MVFRIHGYWFAIHRRSDELAYTADTRKALIALIESDGENLADYQIERNWWPFHAENCHCDRDHLFAAAREAREHEAWHRDRAAEKQRPASRAGLDSAERTRQ